MFNLKSWLAVNGLTVHDFALGIDVPLSTVEGWVSGDIAPSPENQDKLTEYAHAHCAHHWVIAVPDGPFSEGVCQRCELVREFQNSSPEIRWSRTLPATETDSTVPDKSVA